MSTDTLTTRLTRETFGYRQAVEDACTTYDKFNRDSVAYIEPLAKLVLKITGSVAPVPAFTRQELNLLDGAGFICHNPKQGTILNTEKGRVALNMISVDYFDGTDLDVSLREPFVEIDVIEQIMSGVLKTTTNR